MTDPEPSYTEDAHIAFLMALRDQPDFPAWFTRVLCAVAADPGSSDVLTRTRTPGKPSASSNISKAPSVTTTTGSTTISGAPDESPDGLTDGEAPGS